MLVWKDEYSVGIEEMDNQHKKIFEIAWRVHDLLNNDIGYHDQYDQIISIVGELRDYAKYHFEQEEQYLEKQNYKGMFQQKVEHDKFNQKFAEIDFEHIDDNQSEYIRELLDFVLDWIVTHILDVDKGYAEI